MVYNYHKQLQSLLFPPSCRLCGISTDPDKWLCNACCTELPWLTNGCAVCARPLAATANNAICGSCQQHPPAIDHALAPLRYDAPVDYLVQRLKFSNELATAKLLAQLFVDQLDSSASLPGLLIPVPLHPSRLRTRGYNQSAELARYIGRLTGLPISYRTCKRHRKTETQSLLPAGKRKGNLQGAFSAIGRLATDHVAIIDDVMTSGHTVNELANVLKDAGVQRVDVWVIARAGIN